ncbi:unnamed protein product [Oncorhynchus mykiss]|uniref:CATSPERD/E C-terminal domain-containing protein n=1 Tax=Oncorhynchus mykiss TaxID=8022 RepID=A0A060WYY6_ONCMY|nr:unnamed protein product [Oncorhynchus mykiss]
MPSWKACRNVEEHNHLHEGHVHSRAASGQLLLRHPQYVFLVEEVLFRPSSASSDLHISYYSITDYFCPLLVYHDTPWRPSMELYYTLTTTFSVHGAFLPRPLPSGVALGIFPGHLCGPAAHRLSPQPARSP